jgi:hypothetical protein
MKRLTLVAMLVALAGCATTANYEKMLNSWIGVQEIELVRSWGPPANSYSVGSNKFLVYNSSRSMVMPGVAPTYTATTYGNTTYVNSAGGTPAYQLNLNCQTTFEIQGERIVSYSWRGNNCTAM